MAPSWPLLLIPLLTGAQGLKCLDGHQQSADSVGNFTSTECSEGETWCMSVHTKDSGKPTEDFKTCWDPAWDNGVFSEDGCQTGQQCLGGVCYENATVCLCNDVDDCNSFVTDGNYSTPHPWVPSTPADHHKCYYGSTDGEVSSLDYKQVCRDEENLCVRVTANSSGEEFEFRSCWSGDYNIQYTRPGCYEGFRHCHITEQGERCHNETMVCVCEDTLCNDGTYSSEAPPVTPGSGLFCYTTDDHDRDAVKTQRCDKHEVFCLESYDQDGPDGHSWRGCWSPDYEEGRYNYTGTDGIFCETGQHCMFGHCYDNTVCLCEGNLCNDFQIKENATTPAPVPVTTNNATTTCFYGHDFNATHPVWNQEACGPEETACMLLHGDDGHFKMASCYDLRYNDGRYNATGKGSAYQCYDSGEHCWDNTCHKGQICLCANEQPLEACNDPNGPTPSPDPTTPGSGLTCHYGEGWEVNGTLTFNLTEVVCNINETMCIAAYGDDYGPHNDSSRFFAGCHDPHYQSDKFNQSNVCIDDEYCWGGTDPHDCRQDNVCTCDTDLCNTYNVSSTVSPGTEPPTQPSTMRCWFGEQHSSTGHEEWKVEVCQDNEHHCFQLISHENNYESRACWDLEYEDEKYKGDGCYRGEHCHHEHCFGEATVCICHDEKCNDWTSNGTVTTDVPITEGSGVLCYKGSTQDYEADFCLKNQTMCMYLEVENGPELVGCYDPHDNDGAYDTDACSDNVDVDVGDHEKRHGKFCVCDGQANALCNEEYFKNSDNGGSALAFCAYLSIALNLALLLIY